MKPYQCPRCGYSTKDKYHMRRHLYNKKKDCPGMKSSICLDDSVKENILQNRIYIAPVVQANPQQVINQTINNYNQINNFISKMDVFEKLDKYTKYKNIEIMSLEDRVDQTYQRNIERLETNAFKDFSLDYHSILDVINTITTCDEVSTINVLHDSNNDKLKIYNQGKWDSFLFEQGTIDLITNIQSSYLDYYERYLLKKAFKGCAYEKQCISEKLEEYYKFLVCFDLNPLCKNMTDADILDDDVFENHTTILQDLYYKVYKHIHENIKLSEANKLRKQVYDIIKKNNRSNMIELNQKMMDLLQVDKGFKDVVLEKIRLSMEMDCMG